MAIASERQPQPRSQWALDVLLWCVLALLLFPPAVALSSLLWPRDLPSWMLPATMAVSLGGGTLLSLLRASARSWWVSLAAAPLLGAVAALGALLAARSTVSQTPPTGVVVLGAYMALLSAALPWLVFRAKQAWLAIVVVWITVAGVWHASLAPSQVWWLVVLLLLSLLLLGLAHLREEVRIWNANDLQRLGPVLWPSARAITALSLLVAVVGVIPLATQLGVLSQIWRHTPPGQAGQLPFDSPQGTPVAVLGAPLTLSAPDVSSTQVILTYDILAAPKEPNGTGASPATSYIGTPPLLGATLDTFDGTTWTQSGRISSVPVSHALQVPTGSLTMSARITVRNAPRMANGSYLLGFDQPLGFSVAAKARVVDGSAPTPLTVAGWEATAPLAQGGAYTTTAAILPDAPVGTGTLSPAFLALFTATPSDQTEQLRALAQSWIGSAQTPTAKAAALLNALETNMTLDPQAAPPAHVDGVQWFLQGKRGNVLLFTTAYILLGRAIGLPLRMAEGYLPGIYDVATHRWVVRASDATVWAQLAIPGLGWQDLFPGSSPTDVAVPSRIVYSGTPLVPTPTPQATQSPANLQRARDRSPLQDVSGSLRPALIGGAALLILLALLLVALVLSWRWSRFGARLGPLTQFFARVALLAKLAGIRLAPSDTATQATAKVTAYLPKQTETLVSLNSVYERMRYGPPDKRGVLSNLGEQWQHVRGALVRLVVTRPWRRRT